MTKSRDPDRLIRAFLVQGETDLPDQIYDAVRDRIEHTSQRVFFGPWRTPTMNTYLKAGLAAAAVVVAAIFGLQLLDASRGVGGGPTPTPQTQAATATPAASEPAGDVNPPVGPLSPGTRYAVRRDAITFSFAVPVSGWNSGTFGFTGHASTPEHTLVTFFPSTGTPGIFTDPCAHEGLQQFEPSAAGDAEALASLSGVTLVNPPSDVTIDGRAGQFVAISVPEDVGCANTEYWLGHDPTCGIRVECTWYPTWLGSTLRTWIIDFDNEVRLRIQAETRSPASEDLEQELQQIVDSIQFE
jgi:hypothetical protein